MDLIKDIVPNFQLTTRLIFPDIVNLKWASVFIIYFTNIAAFLGIARTKMVGHSQIPAFSKGLPHWGSPGQVLACLQT
jgi:hypothetical protein